MRSILSALVLIIASTAASADEVTYNLNAEDESFVYGLQYPIEDHPNCDYRELRMEYRSGIGFLREDMFRDFYMLITDTDGHREADDFLNHYETILGKDNNTVLMLRFLEACKIYIVS